MNLRSIAQMLNIPDPMTVEQEQAYQAEKKRREDQEQSIHVRELRDQFEARVPRTYRDNRLASPELAKRVKPVTAIDLAAAAVDAPWVTIIGPPGSGKTSLGVAMLYAAFDDGEWAARFIHAYRLGVARIQSKAGEGECPEVVVAMRNPLVLIDDLGSERDTANNAIPDVIQERHAESLPTWVTTGLSPEECAKRYGGGTTRRLFEMATVIKLGGGGRRL